MAYTITYLGSQVETTLDKTLIVANCVTADTDALIVFAGALDPAGSPTVEYGGVSIIEDDWRVAPVSRLAGGIWFKSTVWNGRTSDVTVTFGTNVSRRWCIVYSVSNGGRKDVIKRNVQDTLSTVPSSLSSDTLSTNNELMMAYHLSNGPITDVAGTPESGLTALHRIGSSIGTDDITVQTTMKEVVTLDGVRSRMTDAASSYWLSALIAIKPIVQVPALDANGSELGVGDTVRYSGITTTIVSFIRENGVPIVITVLANGENMYAHYLDLVE